MSVRKEKLWWEKQRNGGWKQLVSPFARDPKIRTKFDRFIRNFYWQFRKSKGIAESAFPKVKFLGFGNFIDESRSGYCSFESEAISNSYISINLTIFINQHYFLDRLGMPKIITDYHETPEEVKWNEILVGFENLIRTIAHELAHAFQQTVNNFPPGKSRSSCKSTGKKDANGNFLYPKLVAEHTQLTNEIEQLITNSLEYQSFQTWWRDGTVTMEYESEETENKENNEENQEEEENSDEKKCPNCNSPISPNLTYCSKCDLEKEKGFELLSSLLKFYKSPNLTTLEKNYQTVKKNPLYAVKDNKKKLDKEYDNTKKYLQAKEINHSNTAKNDFWSKAGPLMIGGGIVLAAGAILLIFFGRQKK